MPVAIRGTIDILPRGGKVMQTGRRVDVTIGEPIPVVGRDLDALIVMLASDQSHVVNGAVIAADDGFHL